MDKPLATWKDPSPLAIKYFAFASYDNGLARYYYNCANELKSTLAKMQNDCKSTVTNDYKYTEYLPIGSQPGGYILNMALYVLAARDAHILLAADQESERNAYEICMYLYLELN